MVIIMAIAVRAPAAAATAQGRALRTDLGEPPAGPGPPGPPVRLSALAVASAGLVVLVLVAVA
jgi:hypothetical protein